MNAQPIPVPQKETDPRTPTITVSLDAEYQAYVLAEAKKDDRPPAKWLKRFIQKAIDAQKSVQ